MSCVRGVEFVVSNLQASIRFFKEVLEFTELETTEEKGALFEQIYQCPKVHAKRARMKLGNQEIFLTQFLTPSGKTFPKDSTSSDLWFQHIAIVVSDMDKAYKKLVRHKVTPISKAPQLIPEWNKAAAGIQAFYFRSPDHHPLEIISYPPGKGRKEWQDKSRLFLGIDHTAIAVSDTEKSLHFYQETLGLHMMGEGLNYGETQENLSSIVGAKVRITGLCDKKGVGIGLEFLHYLEGKKGRPSTHALHDLSATKTVIEIPHIEAVLKKLDRKLLHGEHKIGPKSKAIIIADPDRHHLLLSEREEL